MPDMSVKWGPYKHVRRPSRCTCPDCAHDYGVHNGYDHCSCQQCVEYREANAPAPSTTPVSEAGKQYFDYSGIRYERTERTPNVPNPVQPSPQERRWWRKNREGPMSNITICDRPGCNAIIKGNAAGMLDFWPNVNAEDVERKHFCPPCAEDIDILLHSEPLTERERGYDKPYKGWEAREESDSLKSATNEQVAAELFQRMMKQAALDSKAHNAESE